MLPTRVRILAEAINKLLNDLLCLGTPACGTLTENRKDFLQTMKNGKQCANMTAHRDMR